MRVEPQSAVGLLNTHLFNSALAHFFFIEVEVSKKSVLQQGLHLKDPFPEKFN